MRRAGQEAFNSIKPFKKPTKNKLDFFLKA